MMRCNFLVRCVVFSALIALSPESVVFATESREWSSWTRDVYLDGVHDSSAQIFADASEDSRRVAVLAESLPGILVFDSEDPTFVGWLDSDSFEVSADRSSASSAGAARPAARGHSVEIADSGTLIVTDESTILISRHRGVGGELSEARLWTIVPEWQARAEAYEPETEPLEALSKLDRQVEITAIFGTWCGDSKRHVPAFVSAVKQAQNPNITTRLVSIPSGFDGALDVVQEQQLTNVPTFIVTEDGEEIGRVVETPAGESVAADLAAILSGETLEHTGRWDRQQLIASGEYDYLGQDGTSVGGETWKLYSTEDSGRLLHSTVQLGDQHTELWQRLDSTTKTEFVELTRRNAHELARTRIRISDDTLSASTRGSALGLVDQQIDFGEDADIVIPAAASAGFSDLATTRAWRLTPAGGGRLEPVDFQEATEPSTVELPDGTTVETRGVQRTLANQLSQWWLHPELQIPVKGRVGKNLSVTLTRLDVEPAAVDPES